MAALSAAVPDAHQRLLEGCEILEQRTALRWLGLELGVPEWMQGLFLHDEQKLPTPTEVSAMDVDEVVDVFLSPSIVNPPRATERENDVPVKGEIVESITEQKVEKISTAPIMDTSACEELCARIAKGFGLADLPPNTDKEVRDQISNLHAIAMRSINRLSAELYSQVNHELFIEFKQMRQFNHLLLTISTSSNLSATS